MLEFGERLRNAREAKGMTQQSLAEQLFVTRQAVSKWECGDRFPDLITTKKLSTILGVSMDELMADTELKSVVEKSNVPDNPLLKKTILICFALLAVGFVLDGIICLINAIRTNYSFDYSVFFYLIYVGIYVYGFILALKGDLIPRKVGVINLTVFVALFISSLIRNLAFVFESEYMRDMFIRNTITTSIFPIISIIACVEFYFRNRHIKFWSVVIYIYSVIRIFSGLILMVFLDTHVDFFLLAAVWFEALLGVFSFVLIIFTTDVIYKKRKTASLETESLA